MRDSSSIALPPYCGPLTQAQCEDLMPAVRSGCPVAIEQLIGSVAPLITKITGRYMHHLPVDAIEDLHQHVMLVCVTAASRYTPHRCKPTTYFSVTADFACRSFFTRWRREQRLRPMPCDEDGNEIDLADLHNDTQVIDDLDQLANAFTFLRPREKEILWLRASGQTLEGIGEQLGLTRERVRQIEYFATQRLARLHANK